jgi:hypothetical protein
MKAKKSNDYLIDWNLHKSRRFGIAGVNLQDVCVTENEGPSAILDRTKENLCAGDLTIIKARQMLLNAAQALRDESRLPAGARDPAVYRVRGCAVVISDRVEWTEGARESVTVPAPD